MSGSPTEQSFDAIPPIAGLISVFGVSTTAAWVDLSTIGDQSDATDLGCVNKYVWFQADGGDVYVLFGASQAAVNGAGVSPLPTVNGTSTTGKNVAQGCVCLKDGSWYPLRPNAKSQFLGFVSAAGTPSLRVFRASP